MRKTFIAGNWKMHGTVEFVQSLLFDLKEFFDGQPAITDVIEPLTGLSGKYEEALETVSKKMNESDSVKFDQIEVAVMPSYVFLHQSAVLLEDSKIALGAQNVADALEGAFTGEVSAKMLREFDCEYVIIGHSERRQYYGETDALIAKKLALATECGLKPILCVGEQLKEREQGITEEVIAKQLRSILELENSNDVLEKAVIAYEPVWAIGTGLTATPEQAQQVHLFIRNQVKEKVSALAVQVSIIYGGSVKPSNA
ncbi:MAG: triose-phosphate isomerase, partial [Gammaproteobacteria bacterium]